MKNNHWYLINLYIAYDYCSYYVLFDYTKKSDVA